MLMALLIHKVRVVWTSSSVSHLPAAYSPMPKKLVLEVNFTCAGTIAPFVVFSEPSSISILVGLLVKGELLVQDIYLCSWRDTV